MTIRLKMSNLLILKVIFVFAVALAPLAAQGAACAEEDDSYLVAGDWDGDGVLDEAVIIYLDSDSEDTSDSETQDTDSADTDSADTESADTDSADTDSVDTNMADSDVENNENLLIIPPDYCPKTYDPDNDDYDEDQVGDVCDNCPLFSNSTQADLDRDGIGDACDDDIDGDLVLNLRSHIAWDAMDTATDTSADTSTDTSTDTSEKVDTTTMTDSDGTDSATEAGTDTHDTETATGSDSSAGESDSEEYLAVLDNCPAAYNPRQQNSDSDELGDACDPDLDGDGVTNEADFCPFDSQIANYIDDASHVALSCLGDADEDGVFNYKVLGGELLAQDNCPYQSNPTQDDIDGDGIGDVCDNDADGDGVVDSKDNCTHGILMAAIARFNEDAADLGYAAFDASQLSHEDMLSFLRNESQEDLDKDKVGDTCDRIFAPEAGYPFDNCHVVLNDVENCLHVNDPVLQVYSPEVIAAKTSDDPTRLRIFANRENEHLRYTWVRVQGDADGIILENARGQVRRSSAYEYHYPSYADADDPSECVDKSATFETRLEGSYVLRLRVQVLDENGNPKPGDGNFSETFVTINSSGSDDYIADSCGCVTVGKPGQSKWGWLFVVMLFVVVFRRKFARLIQH